MFQIFAKCASESGLEFWKMRPASSEVISQPMIDAVASGGIASEELDLTIKETFRQLAV